MAPSISLILGGARSGKSEFAEKLALEANLTPVYFATATPDDSEMRARIEIHKKRRGRKWVTIEEEVDLAPRLIDNCTAERVVLVDCLTLWLSNLMMAGRNVTAECDRLIESLSALRGPAIFVSNEVGLGIVPENASARAFRDYQGKLNQRLAQRADYVVLISAGLPLTLKKS